MHLSVQLLWLIAILSQALVVVRILKLASRRQFLCFGLLMFARVAQGTFLLGGFLSPDVPQYTSAWRSTEMAVLAFSVIAVGEAFVQLTKRYWRVGAYATIVVLASAAIAISGAVFILELAAHVALTGKTLRVLAFEQVGLGSLTGFLIVAALAFRIQPMPEPFNYSIHRTLLITLLACKSAVLWFGLNTSFASKTTMDSVNFISTAIVAWAWILLIRRDRESGPRNPPVDGERATAQWWESRAIRKPERVTS